VLLHDGTTFSWGWSETTAMSKGNFILLISRFPLFPPPTTLIFPEMIFPERSMDVYFVRSQLNPELSQLNPKGLWMSTLCGESRAPDEIRKEKSCGRTIDDGDHAVKSGAASDSNKDLRYASTYLSHSLIWLCSSTLRLCSTISSLN
jgi:hypothetical protein